MSGIQRMLPAPSTGFPSIADEEHAERANTEVVALWHRSHCILSSLGGTANAVTATANSNLQALVAQMWFWWVPLATNTASLTIDIDELGVVPVVDLDGNPLLGGETKAGRLVGGMYDGSSIRLSSTGASASQTAGAPDIIWRDKKAKNTAGGTFTNGAYRTRDLNFEVRNVIPGASLSGNKGRLPPGTFVVAWAAPVSTVAQHQSRLYNTTAAAMVGESASAFDASQGMSRGIALVTLAATSDLEVQHICATTQATFGFGNATNLGTDEYYTEVLVWRVGPTDYQVDGRHGGALTFLLEFSTTTTDADPGDGKVRLNHATQTSATSMFVDLLAYDLTSIQAILDNFAADATVRLVKVNDPSKWMVAKVGVVTTATGYRKLAISSVQGSSSNPFANTDKVLLCISPPGPAAVYKATSTTSLAIGTGTKTFTTQSGLAYSAGARVRASSAGNTANYMEGVVTLYSGTSLEVSVDAVGGSGTHADWNINIAGNPGAPGAGSGNVSSAANFTVDNRFIKSDRPTSDNKDVQQSNVTEDDNGSVQFNQTQDAAAVTGLTLSGNRATPTAADTLAVDFKMHNSAGADTLFAAIKARVDSATAGAESGSARIGTINAGVFADRLFVRSDAIGPVSNGQLSLGIAGNRFSAIYATNAGGFRIQDTDASHDLIVTFNSNLTADRTFSLVTGDANRTLTLNGNATLNDWFDQSVKAGATPTFNGLAANSQKITSVADPTNAQDVATKAYVDNLAVNVGKRQRVRAATTANITIATALNNGDTLDGLTLATGELVLVKDQSSAAENGVYVVGASPARATEFDTYNEHTGSLLTVAEGTANADTAWLCTSNDGGTLGSTAIVFSKLNIAGTLLAANNFSDVANAATAFNNIKQAASNSVTGVVKVSTDASTKTGTATDEVVRVVDAATNFHPKGALVGVNTQTSSYTLALTDAGKVVEGNNASPMNITVPPNSSVAFPVNTRIDLAQYGAGQITVVAGSGVTIRSSGGKLKLTGQYSGASLYKRGTDEWVLIGDIAA